MELLSNYAISTLLVYLLTHSREQDLGELQLRLRRANERLTVIDRVFRHNFRNDMNVVQGHLELARQHAKTQQTARSLAVACSKAEQLVALSDKLHTVTATLGEPVSKARLDLTAEVQTAVRQLTRSHPALTITTDLPSDAPVISDGSIARVLEELLENSVKHYDGDHADLQIEVSVRTDGEATTLQIRDNGPGIPLAEIEAIADSTEAPLTHGSGVGLWLIVWMTRRAGSDVSFDNHDDGAVVTITFPSTVASVPLASRYTQPLRMPSVTPEV